jgi:uncharacterized protein (TIGR02677 family)
MFRFTTGELSGLYTAILHAFGEANERLETALGLDDVRARLRSIGWFDALDDEDLATALGRLRDWHLLDVIQNHAENYRTASEYERRNLQYSLTKRGEAAFAGVQHALSVLAPPVRCRQRCSTRFPIGSTGSRRCWPNPRRPIAGSSPQ